MQLDRHGIPIIDTADLFGVPTSELRVQHSIPADVERRFRTVKRHHYPSATLYKLQEGRCFYCGKHIEPVEHSPNKPTGYRKCHFLPRAQGFTRWGNKVLSCKSCGVRTQDVYPSEQQKRDFRKLYSRGRFEAVTKGEV